MRFSVFLILSLFLLLVSISSAQECGEEFGGKVCDDDECCSQWGYCGSTPDHCGEGCQSQCDGGDDDDDDDSGGGHDEDGGGDGSKLSRLIPKETFEELLKHRNDAACPAKGFYTYSAFLSAAKSFPDFANSSDEAINKREIAAFLAQTSHETTGGWPTAPDGPNAWGYCFIEEVNGHLLPQGTYCDANYPCPQSYYGRGPMRLSWSYNYRQCGRDLKEDLINNPNLLSKDAILSFKSALWFWMTPQSPKPSCHDVIVGNWNPSSTDVSANRLSGFGVTTNIINGEFECGFGPDSRVVDRIGFYKRYCDIFGVEYGNSLDCYDQPPFGSGLASVVDM